MLTYFIDFLDAPNDLEAAVEARMERQRVIYTGDRRFVVVIEEQALLKRVGDTGTMAGQLDRLLAVMSLPRVSLGIIPLSDRNAYPSVGFWMYDDALVGIETPTASIEVTQPREIAMYAKMFEQLKASAVYGKPARELVGRAIGGLRSE